MSRSGTTLLRMMLDSHSALAIPPETHFASVRGAFAAGGARAAAEAIVETEQWDDFDLPADEFARRVQSRQATTLGDVLRTFYELYAQRRGKSRWGNKTPYYVARMTQVHELLPEAHFVHVVRDGRDVALSTVSTWFGPDDVAGVAKEWSRELRSARRQAQELPFYMELHYEDLVREPTPTLKRTCEFLELEWEPSLLEYHRDAAQRLSAEVGGEMRVDGRLIPTRERLEIHRLVTQPPRPDRIGAWRREMGAADLRTFESIAGETLEAFGYELS